MDALPPPTAEGLLAKTPLAHVLVVEAHAGDVVVLPVHATQARARVSEWLEQCVNAAGSLERQLPMIYTTGSSPAWKRWLSVTAYGLFTRLMYGAKTPHETARRRFERFATVTREAMKAKFPNMVFADHCAGSLAVESLCAVPDARRVVLYLHGGGYIVGSVASYRDRARVLSYRCKAEVFVPEYRLAPEYPFPAALEDALAAWEYVRAQFARIRRLPSPVILPAGALH